MPADPFARSEENSRESQGGLPLVEYGAANDSSRECIRHLSINRAKGLDSLAVILVGVWPFQKTHHTDSQYTYFMGASRAKQLPESLRDDAWVDIKLEERIY